MECPRCGGQMQAIPDGNGVMWLCGSCGYTAHS